MSQEETLNYPEGYKHPWEIWGEMAELSKSGIGIAEVIQFAQTEFRKTREIWLEYEKNLNNEND